MSSDKNLYSLDELGSVGRGRSRHRPRNDVSLYGGKYPFIQTGDIRKAEFYVTSYSQTYNEKGLAQSKLWNEGTLCITIAANIAETAILKIQACFPDSVIGFIADETKADVRFVKYCLETYKLQMQSISQGATQDNLSLEKLLSLKFKLPPLPLQTRIADLLSTYDELIEVNNRRIALLEQTAEQLYKEWFVRLRFPGYAQTKVRKGVPEGWRKEKLGEITSYIGRGISPKYVEQDGIIVLNQKCIRDNKVNLNNARLTSKNKRLSQQKALKPLDILINSTGTGTLGRVAQIFHVEETITVDSHVTIVRAKEETSKLYLGRAMEYFQPIIAEMGRGSTNQIELSRKDLAAQIEILIPPDGLMSSFEEKTQKNFELISKLLLQNQTLRRTRDLLLPRLISGQLSVAEAETALNP